MAVMCFSRFLLCVFVLEVLYYCQGFDLGNRKPQQQKLDLKWMPDAAVQNMHIPRTNKKASDPLVPVGIYYESLCPDCKRFFTAMLYPTFQKIASIMDLKIVPFGNAKETKEGDHWKFTCQHGKPECDGNLIHICAMDVYKNITTYMAFNTCLMTKGTKVEDAATQCGKELGLPVEEVLSCQTSDRANDLMHQAALETLALEPKMNWVPWITLSGKHTAEIQREGENNLVKLVCDHYTGTKPKGCSE